MRHRWILSAGMALLLINSTARALYETYDEWDNNYTVQALLGAIQFEDLKFNVEDSTTPTEVDVSLMPQLGGAWGTLPKGNRLHYGLECSFLLGFMFDDINYLYAGGGGLYASISVSTWMFDLAGGGYAGLFLDKRERFRIYVAGGPSMVYADYDSETAYPDETVESDGTSAFGIGAYARAGLEFRVYDKGMLGMGVRGSWSSVDFSDVGGTTDLIGAAAFVTFTAGL